MAEVLLLSATAGADDSDYNRAPLTALRNCAARDRFRSHHLIEDAESADVILFAEFYGAGWHFERIRRHPLLKRFPEKCFLFCSNPFVIPFLPGIYASIEKRWVSSRTRSGFYLGTAQNQFATFTPPASDLPYLYSFVGATNTASVRQDLAALSHRRSYFYDTSADFHRLLHEKMSLSERHEYQRRYADVSKASKFVLCPRGLGVSTIRLFETMRMGRVPVILSDQWVEPQGPCWQKFSIRVAEAAFSRIPAILEEREKEAVMMGQLAREQWEQWFSDEVAFHRVVECCLAIKSQRHLTERLARLPVYGQYLRPFHARRLVRRKYESICRTFRAFVSSDATRVRSSA